MRKQRCHPMRCNVQKLCGGCSLLSVPSVKQAKLKQEQVTDIMKNANLSVKVEPVIMAQSAIGYRNKVIVGFAKDKDKKIYSGLYAPKSHRVINTSGCAMHPQLLNEIIDFITKTVSGMKYELYNEHTGTGILRHVLLRWAKETGEVMVVLVTSTKQLPGRRNFVNALVKEFPQVRTVIQNINPRDTSVVLQDESIVLYGNGMITDELCGLKISFTASAFYQIHHDQCEKLYGLAKQLLDLQPADKVLDTYCGVGTIGLTLADACSEVTGVEINKDAVKNAIFNARQNDIRNARFVAMDSTQFMLEARKFHSSFDAIVLDPPRAGTTEAFIEAACGLKPKKILYISCDPRTQARDLVKFKRFGYLTDTIYPVDMFPNTDHIETVCLLTYRGIKKGKYPSTKPAAAGRPARPVKGHGRPGGFSGMKPGRRPGKGTKR
ncbi:23S rRNA (uracil(1939)-C(5))-methyltransferase RlmD [Faecalibaculum rodentium]|uniref:23S rRNA (uracil(1939)-C(5))-methyltransferase RlmD n=1 Tax=Faecalibaculum rodentium TaxID=1702221 RepID=UPI0026EFC8FE|nr:23S rRNA (uracil(1939)-C(5))-methyltransferase RlmD [Faecalibaculum rodentium]